ncbi:hypothetical protein AGLY_013544 [Aphis glycines]|uniref:Uncharacterized protein n=1 Tax=Aphis glycines TaxID=307491 RepID=A0A6G0T788_APHGL|nr:hypothetical protein AGLY_013544 [Aphis glycines]
MYHCIRKTILNEDDLSAPVGVRIYIFQWVVKKECFPIFLKTTGNFLLLILKTHQGYSLFHRKLPLDIISTSYGVDTTQTHKQKTHIIVKSIHSSLRSKSKIYYLLARLLGNCIVKMFQSITHDSTAEIIRLNFIHYQQNVIDKYSARYKMHLTPIHNTFLQQYFIISMNHSRLTQNEIVKYIKE